MRNFINIIENTLPMDTASRMQRAKNMGFLIKAYHGTNAKFNEFDLEKGKTRHTTGFAPHFASSRFEAEGYAKMDDSPTSHVLHVLLRIKNPWNNNYDHPISIELYKSLVGKEPESKWNLFAGLAMSDFKRSLSLKYGAGNHRPAWVEIYQKLSDLGYDAMVDPKTAADHTNGYYKKYIVLDPKNVRSVKARFDPAKSESRNLMD